MNNHNHKNFIGVDVSKDTIDIFCKDKSFKIKNNREAITTFLKTEIDLNAEFFCVFESTGGYERTLARTLHGLGIKFHRAHPNKVHAFGKASGQFAKTDKLDAILLHNYAKFIADKEAGDQLLSQENQDVVDLRRLAKSLERNLHAYQCQLKQMSDICKAPLERQIAFCKAELDKINKDIQAKIDVDPEMKHKKKIMITFKGVGAKIASILIAEIPEIGTLSKRQIASLAGVVPRTYQSGKKDWGGHIAGGRFHVRRALYMAALVASRVDEKVRARYQSLLAKGKAKKVALVAIMHDFIVAINAAIKHSFAEKTS